MLPFNNIHIKHTSDLFENAVRFKSRGTNTIISIEERERENYNTIEKEE